MPEAEFDPVEFLEEAVQRPSHEDVDEMREYLRETLDARGVDVEIDTAGNVLASKGSDGGRPHLLLNTHIDTVTPHVTYDRDEETIYGRGSCDAKGPLAAMLAAFFAVDPGDGRLTLAITPDEELLSTGAYDLTERAGSPVESADGVIVGEPTDLDICTAAKGRFQGTITLTGASAHAAEPESGANAVAALEPILAALAKFDGGPDAPPTHDQLGEATLTPTVVEGGDATNQVPETCSLTVDRRSVPPETAAGFRQRLVGTLEDVTPEQIDVEFAFTDRPTPFLEAWETDRDRSVVRTLESATDGNVRPFTAATEASYFAALAPTVVFGPGVLADQEGAVAHSPREYVRVSQVTAAAETLETALADMLE